MVAIDIGDACPGAVGLATHQLSPESPETPMPAAATQLAPAATPQLSPEAPESLISDLASDESITIEPITIIPFAFANCRVEAAFQARQVSHTYARSAAH